HLLCRTCLHTLFVNAIAEEGSYPPRCCPSLKDGITLSRISRINVLSTEETKPFEEKIVEYGELNRTYCHGSECAKFIPKQLIRGSIATCTCGLETCTDCGRRNHQGDCDVEAGKTPKMLTKIAKRKGWKRCWKCTRMIAKKGGCSTVTCKCGAAFCYRCG
ncbi:hypothetical protein BJ508DRAFT_190595, partial [Ascobolus immersus RN42]